MQVLSLEFFDLEFCSVTDSWTATITATIPTGTIVYRVAAGLPREAPQHEVHAAMTRDARRQMGRMPEIRSRSRMETVSDLPPLAFTALS